MTKPHQLADGALLSVGMTLIIVSLALMSGTVGLGGGPSYSQAALICLWLGLMLLALRRVLKR